MHDLRIRFIGRIWRVLYESIWVLHRVLLLWALLYEFKSHRHQSQTHCHPGSLKSIQHRWPFHYASCICDTIFPHSIVSSWTITIVWLVLHWLCPHSLFKVQIWSCPFCACGPFSVGSPWLLGPFPLWAGFPVSSGSVVNKHQPPPTGHGSSRDSRRSSIQHEFISLCLRMGLLLCGGCLLSCIYEVISISPSKVSIRT